MLNKLISIKQNFFIIFVIALLMVSNQSWSLLARGIARNSLESQINQQQQQRQQEAQLCKELNAMKLYSLQQNANNNNNNNNVKSSDDVTTSKSIKNHINIWNCFKSNNNNSSTFGAKLNAINPKTQQQLAADAVTAIADADDQLADSNGNNNNNEKTNKRKYNSSSIGGIDEQLQQQLHFPSQLESQHHLQHQYLRPRRSLTDWLIAPNTRWCGRGNIANTYSHLGGATAADRCCRQHDHCPAFIPSMTFRYGHFNYLPYTLSHCNCDRRFRTCLQLADDADANAIGQLYFNMMPSQCFIIRKQRICRQRTADGLCALKAIKRSVSLRTNGSY